MKGVDTTQDEWWVGVKPPQEMEDSNFRDLTRLELHHSLGCMTDFSVYFGLARMKNLKDLLLVNLAPEIITMSQNNGKISPAACKYLLDNNPNLENFSVGRKKWKSHGFVTETEKN